MILSFIFLNRTTILLLTISFFLNSCTTDEVTIEDPIEEEVEVFNEFLSDAELEFITNLLLVNQEADNLWPDFKTIREIPIFIFTGENQGILINPSSSQLSQSKPIYNDIGEFEKLNMYRNETILEFLKPIYFPNYLFKILLYEDEYIFYYNITWDIEAQNSFYIDYKNRNGFFYFSIFFHELFHYYELWQNSELWLDENHIQNFDGYPLTDETLPLLLLLYDVMIDAYHAETDAEKTKLLKYYVSIQYKLNEIDPTENNLIRNHGFYQEKLEGPSRYLEVFATFNSINNNTIEDPTHGYEEFADNITNRDDMRTVYSQRIFYHTGAGTIHLLKELGYPNLDQSFLIPSNTPYDIAKDFLNMTDLQLDLFLEGAKIFYNWDAYVDRSEYLLSL